MIALKSNEKTILFGNEETIYKESGMRNNLSVKFNPYFKRESKFYIIIKN